MKVNVTQLEQGNYYQSTHCTIYIESTFMSGLDGRPFGCYLVSGVFCSLKGEVSFKHKQQMYLANTNYNTIDREAYKMALSKALVEADELISDIINLTEVSPTVGAYGNTPLQIIKKV